MAFDATNYRSFVSNLFIKPRGSSNAYSQIYFKEIGKLYHLIYDNNILFVKNLEIGGTNNATSSPQMIGDASRLITTYNGADSSSIRRSRRIGADVASVKFPLRTITLSGIAAISDSDSSAITSGWTNLLQDSIDYAMKKFYDPDFDVDHGPNVQNITLDLGTEGLTWSITWEADGDDYLNFFQNYNEADSSDLDWDGTYMDGFWPDSVPLEYHNRYRIIKWYDTLIQLNGDLFDYPGSQTPEKDFYATKISIKWQINNKKFFRFGFNNYVQNTQYKTYAPIYVPVKMTKDFTISGVSPVSITSDDFKTNDHMATNLYMFGKSSIAEPFYLRFGNKTSIEHGAKYITIVDSSEGVTAYPLLRDVKYIQTPEMPTQINLSGMMVYS